MATIISSRTPEGLPNQCPICKTPFCIEPSWPPGDAPCPGCGTLLWFIRTSAGMRLYESAEVAPLWERIREIISDNLGVSQDQITDTTLFTEEARIDSLDLVKLVMELEEEFEVTIPDDEVEKIKTVGDVIDYIIRNRSK